MGSSALTPQGPQGFFCDAGDGLNELRNNTKCTALMLAADLGHQCLLRRLLFAKADVTLQAGHTSDLHPWMHLNVQHLPRLPRSLCGFHVFFHGFPIVVHGFPMVFPWFSHGFPMVFPWFSTVPRGARLGIPQRHWHRQPRRDISRWWKNFFSSARPGMLPPLENHHFIAG